MMKAPKKQAGRSIALLLSGPKGPKKPAAAPDPSEGSDDEAGEDESGETYHLSAEQLKELNETGTVHCDEGCMITADIGGESEEEAPSEEAAPEESMA